MPTKKQKQAVIRQLLIPIILIIAALLYQPVKGLFVSKEKPVETKADGGSLTVSYIDVGQGGLASDRCMDVTVWLHAD